MNVIRMLLAPVAVVALTVLAGCSGDSTPTPGTVTVSLNSPNADDGAVLVTLTGPGIRDAVPANSAYKIYWRAVSATELRLLVVGNLSDGTLATVTVDDTRHVDQYQGTLLEAVSRTDAVRASLSGYSIQISR